MKLFKIEGTIRKDSYFSEEEFITAEIASVAIKKFVEIHPLCNYITAVFICDRDKIIPTIEPIKEKS
jgi:hypothetical protein